MHTQSTNQMIPDRIMALPICPTRHVPVPFFVAWVNGKPEFRAMDDAKFVQAIRERRCWVCGERLGSKFTFVIGPMCAINLTSSEPPCHTDCARYSAQACPFLSRPHMSRREGGLDKLGAEPPAGHMIDRNPGVTLLWTTRHYTTFSDGNGGVLIRLGEPRSVEWFCEGRAATREEVEESVRTGLPILEELARQQVGAIEALKRRAPEVERLYPRALVRTDVASTDRGD